MVRTASSGLFLSRPGWRKGRRKGLKIPREQSHVGSIPTPGISYVIWARPLRSSTYQIGTRFSASSSPALTTSRTEEKITHGPQILSSIGGLCCDSVR